MDAPASEMLTERGKARHLSLEVVKKVENSAFEIGKVVDLNVEVVDKQEVKQEFDSQGNLLKEAKTEGVMDLLQDGDLSPVYSQEIEKKECQIRTSFTRYNRSK